MINTDRIVPVTATDLLSLLGTVLVIVGKTVTAVQATNPGEFEVTEADGDLLAAEPITTLDFAEDVTSATLYFIPAYDYAGFTIAGATVETEGVEVSADGRTLYTATLADGAVTIAQIGF